MFTVWYLVFLVPAPPAQAAPSPEPTGFYVREVQPRPGFNPSLVQDTREELPRTFRSSI